MAQANSRSSNGRKAIHVLSLFSLLLLIQKSNAYQFKVGGSGSWSPSDPNSNSYNQWAKRSRFQIGDTLLFLYSGDTDSVLLVNEDDYNNCNTDNPIQKFSDGHTEFKFEHSGSHHFISGVKDHCLKNEKLTVVVMADRRNHAPPPSNETAPAPAPTNETSTSSPPSPTAEGPPSPAPSGEEGPSPPAGSSVDINPTPAPSEQSKPKKNGASSIVKSFIAPMGAFVGSCLLMVF